MSGRSGSSCEVEAARRARARWRWRRRITSSTRAPVLARLDAARPGAAMRSSRLSTSRDRRALSALITEVELARAPPRQRVSEPRPPAAAVIAVSGERRSCETERRSGGLHHVRAAQCLRLDHLRLELLAPRARRPRASPGPEPRDPGARRGPRLGAGGHEHRADAAARPRSAAARAGAGSLSAQRARSPPTGRSKVWAMRWLAARSESSTLDAARAARAPARRTDRPRAGGARPLPPGRARRPRALLVTGGRDEEDHERHPVLARRRS